MITLKLMLYFLLVIIYIKINNKNIIKNGIKLSLVNIFIGGFVSYTLLPILSCYVNDEDVIFANKLLEKSIIILLCLMIGEFLIKIIIRTKKKKIRYRKKNRRNILLWNIFFGVLNVVFIFGYITFVRGGIGNFLSASYRESYVSSNTVVSAFLYGTIPYTIVFLDKNINDSKRSYIFSYIFIVIYIVLFLLGGQRNLATMVIIAIIWMKYKDIKINIFIGIGMLLLGIVLLGLIAVFREYNITNVLKGEVKLNWDLVWKYVFSINHGELGTTLKFEKYKYSVVSNFSFPFRLGYSYFILPILNLVPRGIWKDRPLAYADYFSQYAFGYFDGIGYGFSPIYEAEINFGMFWWIIFIVLGMFLYIRDIKSKNREIYYNNGLMACLVLNFFRIDFAVYFKFYIMMVCFKKIYLKCLK